MTCISHIKKSFFGISILLFIVFNASNVFAEEEKTTLFQGFQNLFSGKGFDTFSPYGNSTLEKGQAMQYQGGVSFSGGSWNLSAQNTTVRPFAAKAPTFSAGCGGISFDFGGFSMLDADSIVKFLESMIQQAPGYLVELALQILCPSCLDIMNTLQAAAQTLNSLQFDSCQTLNLIGDSLKSKLAASGYVPEESSFNKTLTEFNDKFEKFVGSMAKAFNCAMGQTPCIGGKVIMGEYTLAQMIYKKILDESKTSWAWYKKLFFSDNDAYAGGFIAALFGDVYSSYGSGGKINATHANDTDAEQKLPADGTDTKIVFFPPIYGANGVREEIRDDPGKLKTNMPTTYFGIMSRFALGGAGYSQRTVDVSKKPVQANMAKPLLCDNANNIKSSSFSYYKVTRLEDDGKSGSELTFKVDNNHRVKKVFKGEADLSPEALNGGGAGAVDMAVAQQRINLDYTRMNCEAEVSGKKSNAQACAGESVCSYLKDQLVEIAEKMHGFGRTRCFVANNDKISPYAGRDGFTVAAKCTESKTITDLTAEDFAFLEIFSFPMYKVFNKLSINDDMLDTFAEAGLSGTAALVMFEFSKLIADTAARVMASFKQDIVTSGVIPTADLERLNNSIDVMLEDTKRFKQAGTAFLEYSNNLMEVLESMDKQDMRSYLRRFSLIKEQVGYGHILPGTGF